MQLSDLDAMLGRMMTRVPVAAESTVRWLLRSDEPAIRCAVRQDLLDEPATADASLIMEGSKINALLSGQEPDGGFAGDPSRGWRSTKWRLVALVELGVAPDDHAYEPWLGHCWIGSGQMVAGIVIETPPGVGPLSTSH